MKEHTQDPLVTEFYSEMELYNLYKDGIKKIEELMQMCYDALGASPSAPPIDRVPIHTPPNIDNIYKIREEIDVHTRNIERRKALIKHCDEVMAQMTEETRKAVELHFIKGYSWENVGRKLNISRSGLEYVVEKEILRILKISPQTNNK